jgi:hypothetical protein
VGPVLRERLVAWLGDPLVVIQDPETTSRLGAALTAPAEGGLLVRVGPHGGVSCSAKKAGGPPLRLIEFDRHGNLLTLARWDEAERLRWAKLRLPDGRWLGIEPGSAESAVWGKSDRLCLLADGAPFKPIEELSHFRAVEYRAVAAIPPLAEPHRLPPGAGTAVLNFLACLLADQGSPRVFYRGPYPTEQLFTALLECFRYDPGAASPLAQFLESDLPWTPAPHERRFLSGGIYVQLRDGVEKVVFRGKAYYRRQWQSVIRSEPGVVREDEGRVICSLWALGEPVEDHLILDPDGEVAETPEPGTEAGPVEPLSPAWRSALGAILAQQSAPALRPWLAEALHSVRLEWGPVSRDLLAVSESRLVLSLRLPRLLRRRLADCQSEAERLRLAVALVAKVSRLVGPTLRLRAQELLALLPEATQRRALERPAAAPPLTSLETLARALAAGGGCPEG